MRISDLHQRVDQFGVEQDQISLELVSLEDLDKVTGKRCTVRAYPWRWPGGDGCQVRVVAVIDPEQEFRIESGPV